MAAALGEPANAVPAFVVCGQLLTGYDSAEGMGHTLIGIADRCRQSSQTAAPAPEAALPSVPWWGGGIAPGEFSLPLFTLVIAGLDAFNPCAFFVLLFLLSLMVHARSRARMLLVGLTFVLCSGLLYFLFMAAWLNVFLLFGGAPLVTLAAGVLALVIGALNLKDFFWFRRGPSLSIPEPAKPGLFRRMRGLLAADNLATMLLGTLTLALAANSYELLCTAGFPMVYTRTLTLAALEGWRYYGYLALYNLIYVLPLLAIVLAFALTLGTRKLSERQGRTLKLLSGWMMLGLGGVLLFAPEALGDYRVALALLALAGLLTAILWRWQRDAGH